MEDFIFYTSKTGKKSKKYRSYCYTCGLDKGYIRKNRLNKECHSCNSIRHAETGRTHAGKREEVIKYNREIRKNQKITVSEETKKKISETNKITWARKHFDPKKEEQKVIRKAFSKLLSRYLKRRSLKPRQCKSKFDLLNFSPLDLKQHLESKFQSGMSWDNYGQWELDHVQPDAMFDYLSTNDLSFNDSWSLKNFQPLWKEDHKKKTIEDMIKIAEHKNVSKK